MASKPTELSSDKKIIDVASDTTNAGTSKKSLIFAETTGQAIGGVIGERILGTPGKIFGKTLGGEIGKAVHSYLKKK